MVDKAVELAHTIIKYAPKGCKASDAFVILVCFSAMGLLAGFFIGTNLK